MSPAASWLLLVSIAFAVFAAMSALYTNSLEQQVAALNEELERVYDECGY
jgi:hypothetical protein